MPQASQILGLPVAIATKPGAAEVARAAPDGCTLLQGINGTRSHPAGVRCARFNGTDNLHIEYI